MKDIYLVILLKSLVVLPQQEIKIELINPVSKETIEKAYIENDGKVLVVAPLSQKEIEPSVEDLPKIGVIAQIKSKFILPNGNMRVTLVGENRIIVKNYFYQDGSKILKSKTMVLRLPKFDKIEENAVKRKLKKSINNYIKLNPLVSNEIHDVVENSDTLEIITNYITPFLNFSIEKKLDYMQMINPVVRAESLIEDIEEEIEIIKLELKIDDRIQKKLEKKEQNFILNEKINALKEELGEEDVKDKDVKRFTKLLNKLKINSNSKEKLKSEINKYKIAPVESSESFVIYNYLETVLNLPWDKKSEEFLNPSIIKSYLDSSHYAMEEIKDRVCDYAYLKKISPNLKSPIICLVGPPGVGKTTIASKIAESLNREFYKISVGGLNDSLELVGVRRTYMGASYGKIIDAIKKTNVSNPVILIDEVDKLVKDYKGDPASALLNILDPSQNKSFVDNYIEEPFDLSNVMFILTANVEDDISYVLRDRLEILYVDSYAFYEKVNIAQKHLVPAIYNEYGNKTGPISKEIISYIIQNYTYESGVRDLDKLLHKLIRKALISKTINITLDYVREVLKEPTVLTDNFYEEDNLPGVCNVLATTYCGGLVSNVEVVKNLGSGKITITGNTGKVMDESVSVALTYIKTNYFKDVDEYDVHIHLLAAATSKDGPSAGVAMTTALLSSYLDKLVSRNIAFTGEISLNGKIICVGAVKDKVIAAINGGMKIIYIPSSNESEIKELPEKFLEGIEIKLVNYYDEIYKDIFI